MQNTDGRACAYLENRWWSVIDGGRSRTAGLPCRLDESCSQRACRFVMGAAPTTSLGTHMRVGCAAQGSARVGRSLGA
eukprot:353643-Chlamydomonas_euryale.AAC.11